MSSMTLRKSLGTAAVAAGALLIATVTAASAQNLVVNPNFDTGLTSWLSSGGTTFDAAIGSPAPGSARFAGGPFGAPLTIGGGVFQCINGIVAGTTYDFGGQVLLTSSPTGGSAFFAVIWFSGVGCTGSLTAVQGSPVSALGSWLPSAGSGIAPVGAVSATISMIEQTTSTPGDFIVNADSIFLQVTLIVPTMSEWALIVLAIGLGLTAILGLRGRMSARV